MIILFMMIISMMIFIVFLEWLLDYIHRLIDILM